MNSGKNKVECDSKEHLNRNSMIFVSLSFIHIYWSKCS